MTTYSYRIALNDREMSVVKEALLTYLELCKSGQMAHLEPKSIPNTRAIEDVISRLFNDMVMTSTSSPCWPSKIER